MEVIKTISLLAIAVALGSQVWLSEVRPRILLSSHSEEYKTLYGSCQSAKASYSRFSSKTINEPERTAEYFGLSLKISMMDCHSSELLRRKLLSGRVKYEDISYLEILSLGDSVPDIDHLLTGGE